MKTISYKIVGILPLILITLASTSFANTDCLDELPEAKFLARLEVIDVEAIRKKVDVLDIRFIENEMYKLADDTTFRIKPVRKAIQCLFNLTKVILNAEIFSAKKMSRKDPERKRLIDKHGTDLKELQKFQNKAIIYATSLRRQY